MAKPLADRFWAKVNKTDSCWLWTGYTHRQGYGRMWGRGRLELAHRVSWELHFGPVPIGMCVLHQCDCCGCVRPSHLFLGTQTDNIHDMEAKGRANKLKGSQHHQAKLTEAEVRAIRARHAIGNITQATLAAQYSITPAVVSKIILRKQWRHLT
jgi:hypothetical protein